MVASIDTDEGPDRTQHSFILKIQKKPRIGKHIWQTHSQHYMKLGKHQSSSTTVQFSYSHASQHSKTRSHSFSSNRREQTDTDRPISPSASIVGDMILYVRPKDSSQKNPWNWKDTFSRGAGYKISTQKSLAFLYTNRKQSKKESGNNPIYNSLKNMLAC
jgi:hypothetical protein